MPLVPITLGKGAFQNVDETELSDPSIAAVCKNLLITDAGGAVDRPGLSSFGSIGTYPVIGATFFAGKLVLVDSNRRIYSMTEAGVVTDITGTVLAGTSRPVFATDGTYLAIAGGGAPRTWTGTGNTALMAGSPPACTHIFYLDGYWLAFVLNDQEWRWAGPTSATRASWDSSNFFQAEGLPDNIVAGAVHDRHLYAWGPDSIEIFHNYGDTVTPFQRLSDGFVEDTGTDSPYSIVAADNTLYFLDSQRRFMYLQGRTPVLISTPYDKVIRGFTDVTDCFGYRININGHYVIAWTFPTDERTLVYDYKTKEWSEWDGYELQVPVRFRGSSYVYVKDWNRHFIGDYRNGTIYELTPTAKADGSHEMVRLRRTGWYDHGTGAAKKSTHYLFHVKRGVGTTGGTEPLLQVRVNDDNAGWSEPQLVGLGFPGESQEPIRVDCPGIYRKRKLEFQMSDAAELDIAKIEENVMPLIR